jgi:hypothetical protein
VFAFDFLNSLLQKYHLLLAVRVLVFKGFKQLISHLIHSLVGLDLLLALRSYFFLLYELSIVKLSFNFVPFNLCFDYQNSFIELRREFFLLGLEVLLFVFFNSGP